MSNNHIMDFRNTVEAIVNDKIIEPIRENKLVIRELKENSHNKEIIITFGRKYADFLIGIIEEQMRYVFPVKEYRGYIFTTKPTGKNTMKGEKYLKCDSMVDDIFIKFFSSNTPHDFRKLSLPFKNVG